MGYPLHTAKAYACGCVLPDHFRPFNNLRPSQFRFELSGLGRRVSPGQAKTLRLSRFGGKKLPDTLTRFSYPLIQCIKRWSDCCQRIHSAPVLQTASFTSTLTRTFTRADHLYRNPVEHKVTCRYSTVIALAFPSRW